MTYADFITLMMIFFIVLYTFTPGVQKQKFDAIIGAFKKSKGVLQHESTVSDNQTPHLKRYRKQNWKELNKLIKKRHLENQIHFKVLNNGVSITLGEPVTFKTYSARLTPEAKNILQVIAYSIQKYSRETLKKVKVFGNTDNRPVAKNAAKYPSNWSLGAARAISVVKLLLKDSAIPAKKLEVISYGQYHPVASNKTKEGRRKNRRVRIFVQYPKINSHKAAKDSLKHKLRNK